MSQTTATAGIRSFASFTCSMNGSASAATLVKHVQDALAYGALHLAPLVHVQPQKHVLRMSSHGAPAYIELGCDLPVRALQRHQPRDLALPRRQSEDVGQPAPVQAKFLRALQNGEVRRLGSNSVSHVHVRLVAATNRNLTLGVKEGWFREDLFGRINGLTIHVPALRERCQDIQPLAQQFLGNRTLPADVLDLLMTYTWPGNVRELELKLRVASALAGTRELRPEDFPEEIRSAGATSLNAGAVRVGQSRTLREIEKAHIERVVCEMHGNLSHAAQILGIDRGTLRRKISTYGRGGKPG